MLIPVGVEKDKKTYKLLTIENTNKIVEIKSNNHNKVSLVKFSTKRTEMPKLTFRNLADSCGLQETYSKHNIEHKTERAYRRDKTKFKAKIVIKTKVIKVIWKESLPGRTNVLCLLGNTDMIHREIWKKNKKDKHNHNGSFYHIFLRNTEITKMYLLGGKKVWVA